MNTDLDILQPYPFQKLAELKASVQANDTLEHIALSIGEPKHEPPAFALSALCNNVDKLAQYPATIGLLELRQAISEWASKRFALPTGTLTAQQHVIPVNGTREALFAFTQAVINRQDNPVVITPNPFYQIYEGASLLAGAEIHYVNCTQENHYLPDFDSVSAATWQRCQLLFLCSPGNPTGAVIDSDTFKKLIALADQYDFVIASDECYSELYFDEQQPPTGLLGVCAQIGRDNYERCVVFHSLSKRSNLPGLRSGFVAGDASILKRFLLYRTYHGCALSIPSQLASMAAWQDEQHVVDNRKQYREKFAAVTDILSPYWDVPQPKASFYLWGKTPIDDELFAQRLFAEQHITVLPGSYLGRDSNGINPGAQHVRMALVAPTAQCIEAAHRIVHFIKALSC